ncbi:coiled-coil domain-containing protein 43 isoform X1 [Drosophila obscura]|uniref:coiled-coil domain-containing protein 43 isoform X1 n=1 Tax=Drosophila obscura TaxID=7282 RepID=UPI001BB2211A|nr:coiled-coil domain-containing protein 43 isoform X1 [Drosophila obscura]
MSASEEFQGWLNEQLRQLNTDEGVFGSYIVGILDGEESEEEKAEALEGILSETGSANIDELVATIMQKWLHSHPGNDEPPKKGLDIDVNGQLAKLLAAQKLQQPAAKEREYTEEERRIKQQILAQYSEVLHPTQIRNESVPHVNACAFQTAVPGDDDEHSEPESEDDSGAVARNTNKSDVQALAKEKREQARQDSAAKKLKDKEDREKQKQLREEKKEKRKTVKGERRR